MGGVGPPSRPGRGHSLPAAPHGELGGGPQQVLPLPLNASGNLVPRTVPAHLPGPCGASHLPDPGCTAGCKPTSTQLSRSRLPRPRHRLLRCSLGLVPAMERCTPAPLPGSPRDGLPELFLSPQSPAPTAAHLASTAPTQGHRRHCDAACSGTVWWSPVLPCGWLPLSRAFRFLHTVGGSGPPSLQCPLVRGLLWTRAQASARSEPCPLRYGPPRCLSLTLRSFGAPSPARRARAWAPRPHILAKASLCL